MRTWAVSMCALAAVAGTTLAGPPVPGKVRHEEGEDKADPYAPPLGISTAAPVMGRLPLRAPAFLQRQVNVNAQGQNIVNDAANEPSIAVDPTAPNRMAIGWRQFDTITSNFRQGGRAYTRDGGRTWTFPGVLTPGTFRSDPVLNALPSGELGYNSLEGDFTTDQFQSQDGGQTWGQPFFSFGDDKQWTAVDTTTGPGRGFVYQGWAPFSSNNIFTRSTDGGRTWSNPITVPQLPHWGTLDVGPTGVVYVGGISNYDFGTFVVSGSSNAQNGGAITFDIQGRPNLGGSVGFQSPVNPEGLMGQVYLAVDRSNGPTRGNVYMLASVDPAGSDPADVRFSRSTDGGRTWSPSVRVNDVATGYQWFGCLAVAPNGRLDVVWYDTRADGTARFSELYYSSSTDAGVTWAAGTRIGDRFNHGLGYPRQNKLGDYVTMISDAVGAHLAWAATYNGEQDVYYTRINDFDCNGNGVPDTADVQSGSARDCNGNGIPDSCEIAAGTEQDANGDGVPDSCSCAADFNGDGSVDSDDFFDFLNAYYAGSGSADFNGDGSVDSDDFFDFLNAYFAGCN